MTATPEDSTTSIMIAGTSTRSLSIDLNPPGSSKDITIILTAQSGSQSTYIIGVNRALPLSSDDDLSRLTVSAGSLTPTFAPNRLNYTVDVAFDVTSVTVSATKSDPASVISGDVPNSGQANIPLGAQGTSKNVSITVTAPNGTSKTYTISVTRLAPSSDANLSLLTVSAGSLDPPFAASNLSYTVNVAAVVDSITVSATKSDPTAVMSALGSVIARAGTPTGSLTVPLGLGVSTPVAITVTAQNSVSAKTYTILVNRPSR